MVVTESVILVDSKSFGRILQQNPRRSLFLVKFQTFILNANEKVCDEVCF